MSTKPAAGQSIVGKAELYDKSGAVQRHAVIVSRIESDSSTRLEIFFRSFNDDGFTAVEADVERLRELLDKIPRIVDCVSTGIEIKWLPMKQTIGLYYDGNKRQHIETVLFSQKGWPLTSNVTTKERLTRFGSEIEDLLASL